MSRFNVSGRKRQKDDDDDDDDNDRQLNIAIPILWCLGGILIAMGVVAFGLSIALWIRTDGNSGGNAILRDAFTDLQDNVTALQNCTDCQLSQTVAELQSNFSTFQNGTCTCPDNTPLVTLIEQGRCIWRAATQNLGFTGCIAPQVTVPGYAIVSGGTGYRVGDLFTIADDNASYKNLPTLEITSVGGSGDVLSLIVLGPGCLYTLPVGNITLQTFSVVGTGLTVQLWAGAYTPLLTDLYFYGYHYAMEQRWVAPLQYSNWTVNHVVSGGIDYISLVIDPPEFPFVMQIPPGMTPFVTTYIRLTCTNWDPLPTFIGGGSTGTYPLTPAEKASIFVTDDTSCYASGSCITSTTNSYPGRNIPPARNQLLFASIASSGYPTVDFIAGFYLTTSVVTNYDYVANNAVLTMSSPLTLRELA